MNFDQQLQQFEDQEFRRESRRIEAAEDAEDIDKIITDIKDICEALEPGSIPKGDRQVYRGCARYECLKCHTLYAYRCRCCGAWARRKK